jgi:hypothetical protein
MELESSPLLEETLVESCPQCGGEGSLYLSKQGDWGKEEYREACFWCKRARLVSLNFRTGVSIELQIRAFRQLGLFVHERLDQFGFRDVLRG